MDRRTGTNYRLSWTFFNVLAILLLCGSALSAFAKTKKSDSVFKVKTLNKMDKREVRDRNVDKAALASQQIAIKKIKGLLKNYRGRRQEPILLERLAESSSPPLQLSDALWSTPGSRHRWKLF